MQVIHCTKKLLRELGASPLGATMPDCDEVSLGSWHANLIRIERRKCILFTNDRTLYTILVPGIRKKDLGGLCALFVEHLKLNIAQEGFEPEVVARVVAEYNEITIAPTVNRSVLGSMNDLSYEAKLQVHRAGGLDKADMLAVNLMLNRVPMGAIKYRFAVDKLYEVYGRTDAIRMPFD